MSSHNSEENILTNVKYVCRSSSLITDALQQGHDVAQLPNGDIIITKVKIVNVQYRWDTEKSKMIKVQSPLNQQ